MSLEKLCDFELPEDEELYFMPSGNNPEQAERYHRLITLSEKMRNLDYCRDVKYSGNADPYSSDGKVTVILDGIVSFSVDICDLYAQMCALSDKIAVMCPSGDQLYLYFYVSDVWSGTRRSMTWEQYLEETDNT